jgi:hypothetical protein
MIVVAAGSAKKMCTKGDVRSADANVGSAQARDILEEAMLFEKMMGMYETECWEIHSMLEL